MPYWSLYLQALDYSAYEIGAVGAALMATRVLAPNLWGWLADRTGQRLRIIRLGSLAALLCFCGLFIDTRFHWLLWVVVAFSFFWNAVLAQFEVLTLAHLQPNPGRYGLVRQWGSVGFVLAVLVFGALFDRLSILRLPQFMLATLLAIWLASLAVPNKPLVAPAPSATSLRAQLRSRSVLAFLLASLLLQVSHGPYYIFFSVYLEAAGHSRLLIGGLWILGVLAEIAIFWFTPRLLRRHSLRGLLAFSLALSALRWALIALFPASLSWLLGAQLLHAFSFGLAHAASIELVRRLFGEAKAGQAQALYSSVAFGVGGALGALASGALWDWSPQGVFGLAALAAGLAWFAALAIERDCE